MGCVLVCRGADQRPVARAWSMRAIRWRHSGAGAERCVPPPSSLLQSRSARARGLCGNEARARGAACRWAHRPADQAAAMLASPDEPVGASLQLMGLPGSPAAADASRSAASPALMKRPCGRGGTQQGSGQAGERDGQGTQGLRCHALDCRRGGAGSCSTIASTCAGGPVPTQNFKDSAHRPVQRVHSSARMQRGCLGKPHLDARALVGIDLAFDVTDLLASAAARLLQAVPLQAGVARQAGGCSRKRHQKSAVPVRLRPMHATREDEQASAAPQARLSDDSRFIAAKTHHERRGCRKTRKTWASEGSLPRSSPPASQPAHAAAPRTSASWPSAAVQWAGGEAWAARVAEAAAQRPRPPRARPRAPPAGVGAGNDTIRG